MDEFPEYDHVLMVDPDSQDFKVVGPDDDKPAWAASGTSSAKSTSTKSATAKSNA